MKQNAARVVVLLGLVAVMIVITIGVGWALHEERPPDISLLKSID